MIKFFNNFLNESKKRKTRKLTLPDVDPFGEEDWGYEFINDSDFAGRVIIFKQKK